MTQELKLRSTDKEKLYRHQRVFSWISSIVEILLVLVIVFMLLVRPFRVVGASMQPSLAEGDLLLVDRISQYLRTPQRGDMVVFKSPADGQETIKRIVAFAGETVDIVDGQVYINGYALDESQYAVPNESDFSPITVPDGCVFVLGDNRAQSTDSRDAQFGCVDLETIVGTVRLRITPINKINWFA